MKVRHITDHAHMRWRQRFNHRFPLGLHGEFSLAKRWKQRKLIGIGVRYESQYRYYVTKLCVFVVRAENQTLITVLERKR